VYLTELNTGDNDFEVLSVRHDVKEMFLELLPKSWGSQGDCVRKMLYLIKFLRDNRIELTLSNMHIFKTETEIGSCINGSDILIQFEKWYKLHNDKDDFDHGQ
jgi:hypothetical protein